MKIRTRLTLWYAGVLMAAMLAISVWCYYDLVIEPAKQKRSGSHETNEEPGESMGVDVAEAALYCGLPALVVAIGGGWWMMRKALAPIVQLTAAAERMNEHHLRERLGRTGNRDELDRMTEVFNAMSERVSAAFQRVREFTLHASHELKTPLTVMHGELETWLGETNVDVDTREHLERLLDETQRLARIVDGLTLLTKADAGLVPLAREPVRLDDLVREAHSDAQSLARAAGVVVRLGRCDEVVIQGDRHRLRQLLLNLCDNAVKYNQRDGDVGLDLEKVNGRAEVRISNSGPGIEHEALEHVFDPFFRGKVTRSEVDGCGLGLSISRWIARAHEGELELQSEPGERTVAVVQFPTADSSM
jgi:signal transduction histidine kinase